MAWWSRTQGLAAEPKKSVPKGIWVKCERCAATLYESDLDAAARVCTSCQHHFRLPTEMRVLMSNTQSANSLREICAAVQGQPQTNSYLCVELRKAELAIGIQVAPPLQAPQPTSDGQRG